jgi:serine/threonine protein kinase
LPNSILGCLQSSKVQNRSNFLDLIEKLMRRFPEDRITIPEIRKHPWMNIPDESSANFYGVMSSKVKTVAEGFRSQAMKKIEKHLTQPLGSPTPGTLPSDHLRKLMLEYKNKTRELRNAFKAQVNSITPNIDSSKSSSKSNEDSAGADSEDKDKVRLKVKPKPKFGPLLPTSLDPSCDKGSMRREPSWSSSDSEHQA